MNTSTDSHHIGDLQQRYQREEFSAAVRALLMRPLMGPLHDDFPAVRRQADKLRDWFTRETGWALHIDRDSARLYKRPADLADSTRGLADYTLRRYVLFCLACAVLERADPQITLCVLGERLLTLTAEPELVARGFTLTLGTAGERRDLAAVCRTLLSLGVLQRVEGDEEGFVRGEGAQADALYDVQRRALAGVLASVRGPSTWRPEDAPTTLPERLHGLTDEHVADSEEGRRTVLRHRLARRLLDDPVIYVGSLDAEEQAYLANQRGAMAARLCEAAGLVAEQRAEGVALTDEAGALTDVALPSEGTEAHATLLVAEFLAQRIRRETQAGAVIHETEIVAFLRHARDRFGRYWRKSAREPGAERELVSIALDRLQRLQLIVRADDLVRPQPALARFSLGEAEMRDKPAAWTNSDRLPI